MKRFIASLLIAALCPMGAIAKDTSSDLALQAGYERSVMARGAGRPDLAEALLRALIKDAPRAPQLRFDLGVALAEQGKCVAAARAFDDGKKISGTPSFDRAVQVAMEDLCPGLAPLETSIAATFVYDSNANAGAGDQSITVGGIPLLLSSDAVAKEAFGFLASVDLAYNYRLGGASYLVPSIGFAIAEYTGDDLDSYSITPTISYRYQGDRVDWRVGPTAIWNYSSDGLVSEGVGIVGRASFAISPRSGLYLDASVIEIDDLQNDLADYRQDSASLTFVHNPAFAAISLRAGLSFTDRRYEDEFQNLRSVQANLGVSGSLSKSVGYDLSYSYRVNRGEQEHYFFGSKREDKISTVTGSLSFANLEGWYGRPYIGVSYTNSDSSWETKTYDRTRALFGFTRRF